MDIPIHFFHTKKGIFDQLKQMLQIFLVTGFLSVLFTYLSLAILCPVSELVIGSSEQIIIKRKSNSPYSKNIQVVT